ncbi:hypothetical protein [Lysobacter sp. A421]
MTTNRTGDNPTRLLDETSQQDYWKNQYSKEGYYEAGRTYDEYDPAYRTGYQGQQRYQGKTFDQAEPELKSDYEQARGQSQLGWEKAKHAVKAAWHRVEDALPGDADRDGH